MMYQFKFELIKGTGFNNRQNEGQYVLLIRLLFFQNLILHKLQSIFSFSEWMKRRVDL